jgi:hypothetical protein
MGLNDGAEMGIVNRSHVGQATAVA